MRPTSTSTRPCSTTRRSARRRARRRCCATSRCSRRMRAALTAHGAPPPTLRRWETLWAPPGSGWAGASGATSGVWSRACSTWATCTLTTTKARRAVVVTAMRSAAAARPVVAVGRVRVQFDATLEHAWVGSSSVRVMGDADEAATPDWLRAGASLEARDPVGEARGAVVWHRATLEEGARQGVKEDRDGARCGLRLWVRYEASGLCQWLRREHVRRRRRRRWRAPTGRRRSRTPLAPRRPRRRRALAAPRWRSGRRQCVHRPLWRGGCGRGVARAECDQRHD